MPVVLLLLVVVKDIEGHAIGEEIFQSLEASINSLPEEKILIMYSGILLLMRYALRHPQSSLKKDSFFSELNELRFVYSTSYTLSKS